MNNYTYEEKLHIAKEAYKGVSYAINAVEAYLDCEILCHWDGSITVDDEIFNEHQLREIKE